MRLASALLRIPGNAAVMNTNYLTRKQGRECWTALIRFDDDIPRVIHEEVCSWYETWLAGFGGQTC